MAFFDNLFDEVGNQYGGMAGGLLNTLRPSSSPLLGGLNGARRGMGGRRKTDPRGFPMMTRDGRMATINYGTNLPRLNFIPAAKFLFFVRFVRPYGAGSIIRNMPAQTPNTLGTGSDWSEGLGFTMKRIDRPSISLQTEVVNQYNKKRIIQKKVEYEPISVTFYDTYDQRVHDMFYEYFRYYYGDGKKLPNSWTYDITNRDFQNGPWGFDPVRIANPNDGNFFSHIEIYTFGNGSYNRLDIINPKITKFNPSDLSYEEGTVTQEITMTIEYEGIVPYNEGKKSKLNSSVLSLSRLDQSDFYETEDGEIMDSAFAGSWGNNPDVAQPDIFGNLLSNLTTAAISGKPITTQTVSNSVLNSFGKFNFGAGGMNGGNNTMGSLLTGTTSGLTSGAGGKQILGGVLTSAGMGPVAGAVTGGNAKGLALAGALGGIGGLFSGSSTGSAGSRIQWTGERVTPSSTDQTLAAMNGKSFSWQQNANTYNSASQATTIQDYQSVTAASRKKNDDLPSAEEYKREFSRIRDSYRGV